MAQRLSCWERARIEALFVAGVGVEETARCLGRAPSTIYREFKRAGPGFYDASSAQAAADGRAARPKVPKLVADPVPGQRGEAAIGAQVVAACGVRGSACGGRAWSVR